MNSNTQIATTREQSERLLIMGLKPETADMCYNGYFESLPLEINPNNSIKDEKYLPAWSLSRLLEIMPPFLSKHGTLYLQCGLHTERYNNDNNDIAHEYDIQYGVSSMTDGCENPFDAIIAAIGWMIRKGVFNKKYLKGGDE